MFEQAFKSIDDILRKESGCTTELDYTEQTSWLLFLKYLDALEQDRAAEAELEGKTYDYILSEAYRWDTWAAPKDRAGKLDHHKASTGPDLSPSAPRRTVNAPPKASARSLSLGASASACAART